MKSLLDRIANLVATQGSVLVRLITTIVVTRAIVQALGLSSYADLAAIQAAVGLISVMGNGVTGACVRYVLKHAEAAEFSTVSQFITNSLVLVVALGLCMAGVIALLALLKPTYFGSVGPSFAFVMVVTACCQLATAIFRTGNFFHERFVSSSIIQLTGQITYLVLMLVMLAYTEIGLWAIPISRLAADFLALTLMWRLFRKLLPLVRLTSTHISVRCLKSVLEFSGWMVFVYVNTYIASSGVLLLARPFADDLEFSTLGISLRVATSVASLLTCFAFLTNPPIHKLIATGDHESAMPYVWWHFLAIGLSGIAVFSVILLQGQNLLDIWLGKSLHPMATSSMCGFVFSLTVGVLASPVIAFYAATGRLRSYGLCCCVDTIITFGLLYTAISCFGSRSFVACCWLPGMVALTRICVCCYLLPLRLPDLNSLTWRNQT